ncbi:TIGR03621 family F420-dependent LLM class oxidoreductase [Actinomycetospora sp. NBRC 106378]|uniref:TIGR03621 family F420-dependent LLM class oxidoreductase n=1 Tax=Actinomycetospora sp. NBRC 106378 TaxID=3032208 RepID=UPI0024A0EEBC|nr:TIGR03621 family F420-dependent LLM class oxidoreductase [Actinomycetospora sp. NBRC 106378]GLZ51655.1 LLM class F420-dependent oxidoreductase [Actinomycetospora sp. NBRC 106378]
MIDDGGRPFRFGVVLLGDATPTWTQRCRRVEALGFDTLLVADHLGRPGPFTALGAAAGVTERTRLGTLVLNAAFHDPVLLAREMATLDTLSGGRVELGLGAGYVRSEFDALGIPYGTAGERLDGLERCLDRLAPLLTMPLFLGGNGDRMLRIAAQRARIVGFSGTTTDREGRLSLIAGSSYAERVDHARSAAGDRAGEIEWNALLQVVEITDDRERTAEELRRARAPHLTLDEFLAAPTVLVGTVDEMAAELERRRRDLGLSYITVLEPAMESMRAVLARVRAG